jgi:hypothetical protein
VVNMHRSNTLGLGIVAQTTFLSQFLIVAHYCLLTSKHLFPTIESTQDEHTTVY